MKRLFRYRGALLILFGLIGSLILESFYGIKVAQLVFIVFVVAGFSVSLRDRKRE